MKQTYVRPARQSESRQFLEWSRSTEDNAFDPEAAARPSTFTLAAYTQESPTAYLPVAQVFMLESLAVKPGQTDLQTAVSIRELMKAVVLQAHIKGVGELYLVGSNPRTNAFAEDRGFEKVEYPVYRMKLSDLEKQ